MEHGKSYDSHDSSRLVIGDNLYRIARNYVKNVGRTNPEIVDIGGREYEDRSDPESQEVYANLTRELENQRDELDSKTRDVLDQLSRHAFIARSIVEYPIISRYLFDDTGEVSDKPSSRLKEVIVRAGEAELAVNDRLLAIKFVNHEFHGSCCYTVPLMPYDSYEQYTEISIID